jgi:hypothetical protein
VDRNIKIVRELEQVFDPNRMMFRELEGKGGGGNNVYAKKRKFAKNYYNIFMFLHRAL